MESKFKIGQVIGEYTVVDVIKKVNISNYVCRCICGKIETKLEKTLTSPISKKCCNFCNRKKRVIHKTEISYLAMLARCYDNKHEAYPKYSTLKPPVCSRWVVNRKEGFYNFLSDMGLRPEGTTLDRIDGTLGYSKDNCRWASYETQNFNIKKKDNNTSGRTGVYWNKNINKWLAYIRKDNKNRHLGYFEDFKDAVLAREIAEKETYGFIKE